MKFACMIPARLQSTRFPRKMLSTLGDRPLLEWVFEAAINANRFDEIVFAVDAEEIADLVRSFGGKVHMTSPRCLNGTERMLELVKRGCLDADVSVLWQGDEPFIKKSMIDDLLQTVRTSDADVWTLKKKITDPMQIASIQYPKVVTDIEGNALLFSRSPIPCYRDALECDEKIYYKHIGVYAFSKKSLHKICSLPPAPLELAEQLEQLRWIYHGLKVQVHETKSEVQGIDLPEHLAVAEEFIKNRCENPSTPV